MATRWRVFVHALDRTGPPMLARSYIEWAAKHHPEVDIQVVALRGGPLLEDLLQLVEVVTLLDHAETWNASSPAIDRAQVLHDQLVAAGPATLNVFLSVASTQAYPVVPDDGAANVVWVVEQGEDLRFLDEVPGVRTRTDAWLAGCSGTYDELSSRLGGVGIRVSPEFVRTSQHDEVVAERHRRLLMRPDEHLLVLGAGIATYRKGPDLFAEVAQRTAALLPGTRFVWVGGESDELWWPVTTDARSHGIPLTLIPSVADLTPLLRAADLFVHTARLDSFPLVCLSAALSGTPVLAFEGAGGVSEMMDHTFIGAPYPDVHGLAEQIVSLSAPPRRISVAARQGDRVRTRYTVDAAAPILHAHLVELAGVQ